MAWAWVKTETGLGRVWFERDASLDEHSGKQAIGVKGSGRLAAFRMAALYDRGKNGRELGRGPANDFERFGFGCGNGIDGRRCDAFRPAA